MKFRSLSICALLLLLISSSALATSFKLDWSDPEQDFVLAKSGEKLKVLVARLINQQLGEELVTLA